MKLFLKCLSQNWHLLKKLVKQTMEEAIQLSVPLIADENEGVTWYEAK